MKTIQSKLAVIFSVFLALGVAGMTNAIMNSQKHDATVIKLTERQLSLANEISQDIFALTSGEDEDKYIRLLAEAVTRFDKTLTGLVSGDKGLGIPPTTDTAILQQMQKVITIWREIKTHANVVTDNGTESNTFWESAPFISANSAALQKEMGGAAAMYEEASMRKASLFQWSNTAITVIIVITVVFAWIVIVRPLVTKLKNMADQLTIGADQISAAAEQVASASQNLAQGSSAQAASFEETSASMEEISATTRVNAQNADEAAKLVGECRQSAESGNNAVKTMNSSMGEISASNRRISEIAKIIEGIAFQTNLLALNAAVEAARAGEHGKGFAVVAEEVRSLAQRSADAAKDTSVLVNDCIDKASGGVNLSEECRTELQNIVDGVRKAENLTMAIKAASQEQSVGISEVGGAINQTEHVTQQNAADAEETASISETLAAQVLSLKDQISRLSQQIGRNADDDIRIDQHQERNDITATAPNPRPLRLIQE